MAYKRFRRWEKRGVFRRMFEASAAGADLEYVMIDGTIVKIHRRGQGAKGGPAPRLSADLAAG